MRTLEQSLLAGRVRLDSDDVVDQATQVTLAHTSLIERGTLLRQIEELRGQPHSRPPSPRAPTPPQPRRLAASGLPTRSSSGSGSFAPATPPSCARP